MESFDCGVPVTRLVVASAEIRKGEVKCMKSEKKKTTVVEQDANIMIIDGAIDLLLSIPS